MATYEDVAVVSNLEIELIIPDLFKYSIIEELKQRYPDIQYVDSTPRFDI
jgi:hypothetical protein